MTVNTRGLDRDEAEDEVMIHKDPRSHSNRAIPFHFQLKRIKITQFQDEVWLGSMDATIVIDETVSRELTEHNMVAKRAGFNEQRKNTLLTTTLRNVHYACTWACPTSSAVGLVTYLSKKCYVVIFITMIYV